MIKKIGLIVALSLSVGCTDDRQFPITNTAGEEAGSFFVTEVEGGKIYKIVVRNNYDLKYLSKCGDNQSSLTYSIQHGKTPTEVSNLTDNEIIELAKTIERKQVVLSKLSAEEKEVLGIK